MKGRRSLSIILGTLILFSCAHLSDIPEDREEGIVSPPPEAPVSEVVPEPTPVVPDTSPPPAEPSALPPQPFSMGEMDARIMNLVYPGTIPVTRGGRPLAVYPDLDGNGYPDACVLCVKDLEPEVAVFETLSDSTRIFDKVLTPFSCSVQFFLQKNGKLYRSRMISLGRKIVLESFCTLLIGDDPALPKGASAVFKSRGGTEQEWVLFEEGRISKFTIQESLSIIPVIEDINGDGITDIIVHHQGFEEGRGYETFLVWYNWNGSEFLEYRSTNIVRNLNNFIDSTVDILLEGDWEGFIRRVLSEKDRELLLAKDLIWYEMLPEIFDCESDTYAELFRDPCSFLQIVFPDFYENPFSSGAGSSYEIPVQVRFVTGEQRNVLCSAVIYMSRNPFEDHQFGFRLKGN